MKTFGKALCIAVAVLAILKLIQILADYCDEQSGRKYFRSDLDPTA